MSSVGFSVLELAVGLIALPFAGAAAVYQASVKAAEAARERRLAAERQLQEEAEGRRREAEQVRRRVAELRTRDELAQSLAANPEQVRAVVLADRLSAVQTVLLRLMPEGPERGEFLTRCARLSGRLTAPGPEVEREVAALEAAVQARAGIDPAAAESARRQAEAERLLGRNRLYLQSLPPASRRRHQADVVRMEQILAAAEADRSGDLAFHRQALQWAEVELRHLLAAAPAETAAAEQRRETERRAAGELRVRAAVARDSAVLDEDRAVATELVAAIDGQLTADDADALAAARPGWEARLDELEAAVVDTERRQAQRDAVLSLVQDTLSEMGYEVLPLPAEEPPSSGAAARLHFRTPDAEAVEARFGLDRSLHMKFRHLQRPGAAEPSREELVAKCRRWCGDYDQLLQRLREQGVAVHEGWRFDPEQADLEEPLELPAEAEGHYGRRKEPRRRTVE